MLLFKMLLLTLLLVHTANSQYVLVAPKSYHVGATEQISFTSYNGTAVTVQSKLVYETCKCTGNQFPIMKKVTKAFRTVTVTVNQGQTALMNIKMPNLNELYNRRYYLTVSNSEGFAFLPRTYLNFYGNSFGFLVVKTDKPIYKPSQTVKFCVIYVDKSLRPVETNSTVDVIVRDNKNRQIIQWKLLDIPKQEFKCLEFSLSEEPSFGRWQITSNLLLPSSCCTYYYNLPRGHCSFQVKEFVLPKFDVTVQAPSHISSDDNSISGQVIAKYVFGEKVEGTVLLNATLVSPKHKSLLFYQSVATLTAGKYSFAIPVESFVSKTRYLYNPFCVKKTKIILDMVITEKGRGHMRNKSLTVPLKSDTVIFKFSDDNPKFFRPGMNYTVRVIAESSGSLSSTGINARILATINNETIHDTVITTGHDIMMTTLFVPPHAKCLKIMIQSTTGSCSCECESNSCLSPAPFYSPTGSYLHLTPKLTSVKVGANVVINVASTLLIPELHYFVIAQGGIVLHDIIRPQTNSGQQVKDTDIQFTVTSAMSPHFKLFALFAREDGELVGDLVELTVECHLSNQVNVSFSAQDASPGDEVAITTQSSSDSLVLLSVVDSSLHLLADVCKSATSDNLCKLLRFLTQGSFLNIDTSCSVKSSFSCCPTSCKEPKRYAIGTLFNAAGLRIKSDMFLPTPPRPIAPPTVFPPFRKLPFISPFQPWLPRVVPIRRKPNTLSPSDETTDEGEDKARTYFPESWIWTLLQSNQSGQAIYSTTVPDTITTWTGEALALSPATGLGLSPLASLTVKKLLFVSLSLPYSINWGETVRVVPLVFNFQSTSKATHINISVILDDELSFVEQPPDSIVVSQHESSSSFQFSLKPRSIGHLPLTITIKDNVSHLTDTVTKMLFVKPGCKKYEITETVFMKSNGSKCFNYSLPNCLVPDSSSATLSVTGDIMSFPNVDHLLVLPSGCGEQNLVKTAINFIVAKYLLALKELSDHVAIKIKNNIQIGYQKELNYLSTNGCFSIWSGGKCTTWLTAAVVNYFSAIHNLYTNQNYSEEVVDEAVVTAAVNYLIRKQHKRGKFPLLGRSHNHRLLNDGNGLANTGFTLVALKEFQKAFPDSVITNKVDSAIEAAESFLKRKSKPSKSCTYGLAIAGFAMHKYPANSQTKLINNLKKRIQSSNLFPGTCYSCDRNATSCGYYVYSEKNAVCVETTAYTLLALLEARDYPKTFCLAQWLVQIRKEGRGYFTSQDTILALQALANFAMATFSPDIHLTVSYDLSSLASTPSYTIFNKNRYDNHITEITNPRGSDNCLSWNGTGIAILQSTLKYHGCNCDSISQSFSLEHASQYTETKSTGGILTLHLRMRYLETGTSNMIILDVELPSGFRFESWRSADVIGRRVARHELKGSSVVFYIDELVSCQYTTLILELEQAFVVTDPQKTSVTLYDYYDPGKSVTQYYQPENTDPLPHPKNGRCQPTTPTTLPLVEPLILH